MNLVYKSISATEPVLLAEAKVHLGQVDNYYDDLIGSLIVAARERAETFTSRSLVDKTIIIMLDKLPEGLCLKLPRGPIKAVSSVKYWDGTEMKTLSAEKYTANIATDPGLLCFSGYIDDFVEKVNSIHIEYTVGWGSRTISGQSVVTPIPKAITNAILMMVRTMFDMREDMIKGTIVAKVPHNAEYLMKDYRIFEFL